ncbi:imidazole glycerol phosphate synthase subunit HisH [Motilibacter aurantiacus]|uniref:imidazole glycerol phosphate synthase subunit HisH n=1 Tax=Motilibacter aurantiacus TaxID=2714955 RepID=UPI00140E8D09|nr:imidazole glycerol phosphate synthase subunit HisH [Motilibacter aurantiacus]NHC46372.1 imidazole glycerol phosphate synthase subunit HisH [Motilibacter aurantiacus]
MFPEWAQLSEPSVFGEPAGPKVGVIDYKLNNLASICRRLEDAGAAGLEVLARPEGLERFSHLVLPGVGAFDAAMENLHAAGWPQALREATGQGKPLLGVCLGMQLLGDRSEEGAPTPGLGLVPGQVVRLTARSGERVPHVGWNEVTALDDGGLFAGIAPGADFYFVHSFQFEPESAADRAAVTPYAGEVVSAVRHGSAYGVQFHPEKSSAAGLRLLQNFLAVRGPDAEGSSDPDPALEWLRARQG